MKVVDHIKKETSWNEFICSLTKEELKEYPGKQFAALCIRECHINKDKLDIYHKAFSEVKEKHPEYEWIL